MNQLERLTVADALDEGVVRITVDQTLEEAARMMLDRGITALVVIDPDSSEPGIITEADVGRAMAADADPRRRLVGDFRTADVITATCDWTLDRAARTMATGHFRHLIVVDEQRVIGVLSITDIVAAWSRESDAISPAVMEETGEVPVIGPAHQYLYSLRRSAKQHLVAAKCPCEWDWYGVLEGQLEDRPDLDEDTLKHLWERREPCPALHAEGGGAD
jgi:signal-transduction protein with cAMP-binding, CBS, and nucleotidyltransferase domain